VNVTKHYQARTKPWWLLVTLISMPVWFIISLSDRTSFYQPQQSVLTAHSVVTHRTSTETTHF